MDFTEYQRAAARTMNPAQTVTEQLSNFGLGVAGEAGEIADHVKKALHHGEVLHRGGALLPDRRDAIAKEIGDVLWYLAALCTLLDMDLGNVAALNIEKLRVRWPGAFGEGDGKARERARQVRSVGGTVVGDVSDGTARGAVNPDMDVYRTAVAAKHAATSGVAPHEILTPEGQAERAWRELVDGGDPHAELGRAFVRGYCEATLAASPEAAPDPRAVERYRACAHFFAHTAGVQARALFEARRELARLRQTLGAAHAIVGGPLAATPPGPVDPPRPTRLPDVG